MRYEPDRGAKQGNVKSVHSVVVEKRHYLTTKIGLGGKSIALAPKRRRTKKAKCSKSVEGVRWPPSDPDPASPAKVDPVGKRELCTELAAGIVADPELALAAGEDRLQLRIALEALGHVAHG